MRAVRAWALAGLLPVLLATLAVLLLAGQPRRALTVGERQALETLFCGGVALEPVRIQAVRAPGSLTALALGNTVLVREGYYVEDFAADPYRLALLAHEVAHVWAHQRHGRAPGVQALGEHLRRGESVYAYTPYGQPFASLGREQQGQAVYDFALAWARGEDTARTRAWLQPTLCAAR